MQGGVENALKLIQENKVTAFTFVTKLSSVDDANDASAKLIMEALAHNTSVKHLSFASTDNLLALAVTDATVGYITSLLSSNIHIEELDLSKSGLTDTSAVLLAEMLLKNTTLKRLNLSDNQIATQGAIALAEALKVNSTLECLKLERNPLINSEGIIHLLQAMKVNCGITTFRFPYALTNFMRCDFQDQITNSIVEMITANHCVRVLDFTDAHFSMASIVSLLKALQQSRTVTALTFTGNVFARQATEALTDLIQRNQTLVEINLESTQLFKCLTKRSHFNNDSDDSEVSDDNELSLQAAIAVVEKQQKALHSFCEAVSVNQSLRSLNLSGCGLTAMALANLCEALRNNTTLARLSLCKNSIDDQGAKHLSDLLKVNTGIKILDLGQNNIHCDGCKEFATMLEINQTLKSFNVGNNSLERRSASWDPVMDNSGRKKLFETLSKNTSLVELMIDMEFCEDTILSLTLALRANKTLTNLQLHSWGLDDTCADRLSRAVKCTWLQKLTIGSVALWQDKFTCTGYKTLLEQIPEDNINIRSVEIVSVRNVESELLKSLLGIKQRSNQILDRNRKLFEHSLLTELYPCLPIDGICQIAVGYIGDNEPDLWHY
jgi:Ran GTPase-activating protein (RanGAP) involved in mRNA processing and transport